MFMSVVSKYFPAPGDVADYCNDAKAFGTAISGQDTLPAELIRRLNKTGRVPRSGDVKFVFLTRPGPGPQCLDSAESMLDATTGLPNERGAKIQRLKVSSDPAVSCSKKHCCKASQVALSCAVGAACIALGYFLAGRCNKR